MPNRNVHLITSGTAGGLLALHRSGGQPEPAQMCEVVGGIAGGCIGGRAPDILDPPTSPRHRGRAHSLAVGGGLINLSLDDLEGWQQTCRRWADGFATKQAACPAGSAERFLLGLAEIGCRLLAGFVAGLFAGYLTHLTLDALTPSCINVV